MKYKREETKRTSIHLPLSYIKAMQVIRDNEKIYGSHQIQMGLKLYFEKYRKLLEANGVSFWKPM